MENGLKTLDFAFKDHFKTHLFFSIFGWGDPSQLGSWSEGCVKPLRLSSQVSEDPNHIEFASGHIDDFLNFFEICVESDQPTNRHTYFD